MGESRFVWYELMTTDPEAAVSFYTAVVGWGTQRFEPPGMPPYTMWTRSEVPVGGLMQLPGEAVAQGAHPHWLGYVSVDDVDASHAAAIAAGATSMVVPRDIPQAGRFSVLRDPQGALFALFRPLAASQPPAGPPVPDVSWHELATGDAAAALRFYGQLFGWQETGRHEMGEAGSYLIFGRGGVPMGGMFAVPGPPAWLYYVRTGDLDAAVERVRAHHGQVAHGPMEVPGGDRIAQCFDPQGAPFALHAPMR